MVPTNVKMLLLLLPTNGKVIADDTKRVELAHSLSVKPKPPVIRRSPVAERLAEPVAAKTFPKEIPGLL